MKVGGKFIRKKGQLFWVIGMMYRGIEVREAYMKRKEAYMEPCGCSRVRGKVFCPVHRGDE